MTVKVKKINENAKLPRYASEGAAGCDLFAVREYLITPGSTALIKSDLSFELPEGCFIMVAPRSSLCFKKHLDMPHSVGVCDPDFRGEYMIALRNLGNEDVVIEKGERIAQAIFLPYMKVDFHEVEELSVTQRGAGGFGSTGKF